LRIRVYNSQYNSQSDQHQIHNCSMRRVNRFEE
jgi:hypothetical protein